MFEERIVYWKPLHPKINEEKYKNVTDKSKIYAAEFEQILEDNGYQVSAQDIKTCDLVFNEYNLSPHDIYVFAHFIMCKRKPDGKININNNIIDMFKAQHPYFYFSALKTKINLSFLCNYNNL